MKILVTGGAGFIGSALVRSLLADASYRVITVDCLTYAGNLAALAAAMDHPRHVFERTDIRDRAALAAVFDRHQPDAVMHLAAESHVDRSIAGPAAFVSTNIHGTFTLLDVVLDYWQRLAPSSQARFRFLHVSTDEVYGDLPPDRPPVAEGAPYAPSSPYAASKAAADHLVRAWQRTYGLPVLLTHSVNNYGPFQYPEKLIPRLIERALAGQPLPVFGDGLQTREWLHVDDHVRALCRVLAQGEPGCTYHVGGERGWTNLRLVQALCAALDQLAPERRAEGLASYADLIRHVEDRPGHDRRYALDDTRLRRELGWAPSRDLAEGLVETVRWHLDRCVGDSSDPVPIFCQERQLVSTEGEAMSFKHLEDEVLHLPAVARAALIKRLILSLEPSTDAELQSEWLSEARRRADELNDGRVQPVSADEVLRKARNLLK